MKEAILSHILAALGGGGALYVYLRHVAGWFSAFEARIQADLAHLRGVSIAPSPPPITGGTGPVPGAFGPPIVIPPAAGISGLNPAIHQQ